MEGKRPTVLVVYSATDLRLRDHYPLTLAHQEAKRLGAAVAAVFCFDPRTLSQPSLVGGFFRAAPVRARFLLDTVHDLRENLQQHSDRNVQLFVRCGFPEVVVPQLAQQLNVVSAYTMTQYAPHEKNVQQLMESALANAVFYPELLAEENRVRKEAKGLSDSTHSVQERLGDSSLSSATKVGEVLDAVVCHHHERVDPQPIKLHTVWGSTLVNLHDLEMPPSEFLHEEWRRFYDIFRKSPVRPTAPYDVVADSRLKNLAPLDQSLAPVELGELPTLHDLGYGEAAEAFNQSEGIFLGYEDTGGETNALLHLEKRLADEDFWPNLLSLHSEIDEGSETRQDLSRVNGLRLSAFISTGAISVRRVREMARDCAEGEMMARGTRIRQVRELEFRLARRDYWHFIGLRYGRALFFPYGPRPAHTDDIPDYRCDLPIIQKWCEGLTGYPLADAAMKELTVTGLAHDRCRAALAWFLTRGLGQDWRVGAEWFERCSLDYDPFICWGNFALQAGLIKDRFGEPIHGLHYLAHRHDQSGIYVRRWLPHLTRIPDVYIHRPHVLTKRMQEMRQIYIGKTYPLPMKLWEGASDTYPKPKAYYAGPGIDGGKSIESGLGVGEAPRFGTSQLPKALLPFTPQSAEAELVAIARKTVPKKLLLRRI